MSMFSASISESSMSCALWGALRLLVRATLANSYPNRVGATITELPNNARASCARDSLKAMAAMTDVSATLTGIAVSADSLCGVVGSMQASALYALPKLVQRELMDGRGFFQDSHQLSLKRPMMAPRSLAELLHYIIRNILHRHVSGHPAPPAWLLFR